MAGWSSLSRFPTTRSRMKRPVRRSPAWPEKWPLGTAWAANRTGRLRRFSDRKTLWHYWRTVSKRWELGRETRNLPGTVFSRSLRQPNGPACPQRRSGKRARMGSSAVLGLAEGEARTESPRKTSTSLFGISRLWGLRDIFVICSPPQCIPQMLLVVGKMLVDTRNHRRVTVPHQDCH